MGNNDYCSKKNPLISIITPSFNQGEFIEDTICSILDQDYPNIQLIIIDGGSSDGTIEILKKYSNSIEFISEPDNGQVDAILKGFKMARGEIITWLNSDDVYIFKDTLSKVFSFFQTDPQIDIISGSTVLIDSENKFLQVYRAFPKFNYKQLLIYDFIRQPATFFKSYLLKNNDNDLDRNLHCAFDYDLWLRLSVNHKLCMVRDVLAGIRRHSEMKTIRLASLMDEESEIVQKRYKNMISISIFEKFKGLVLRATNKVLGLFLAFEIYKFIKKNNNNKLAISIATDGLVRIFLRQLLNHKKILF